MNKYVKLFDKVLILQKFSNFRLWCPEIAEFQNEIIGFWITVLLAKKGTYKTEDRRGNEMVCSFHRKF